MNVADVKVDFLGHAGFLFRFKGRNIAIDPYRVSDNVSKADIILITHGHSDHCSIKDVQKIAKTGALVFCPVDCQSSLLKIKGITLNIVEIGDIIDLGFARVECVHAYTLINARHSKQEGWLGYVVKMGNTIFYFAGDTDHIPEMQKLSGYGKRENNFVVFLPVAGDVVMDAKAAADAASRLNPTMAIPMSYGAGLYGTERDAQLFVELCRQSGINAEILSKI